MTQESHGVICSECNSPVRAHEYGRRLRVHGPLRDRCAGSRTAKWYTGKIRRTQRPDGTWRRWRVVKEELKTA